MKVFIQILLTTLAHGIVIQQQHSKVAPADSTLSSARRTLNFGPAHRVDSYSLIDPSPVLLAFNERSLIAPQNAEEIALSFVTELYPGYQFEILNSYGSHSQVTHIYFSPIHQGLPVANAQINVNVLGSQIISYGDSFKSVEKTVKRDQIVFGDNGSQSQEEQVSMEELEEFSSPPLIASVDSKPNDPRNGLLTFLVIASSSNDLTNFLLTADRVDLIDMMAIEADSTTASTYTISNVPETVAPVKASLVYILDGKKLKLSWKYIIESNLNHYEGYVTADNKVEGDEEVLMAVDWVRDFRPTGGEVTFDGMILQGSPSTPFKSFSTRSKSNVAPIPSTPSTVTPSYKVFPWGTNDPSEAARKLLRVSTGTVELDSEASPAGWHTIPGSLEGKELFFSDTRGNNVYAQENWEGQNNYLHNLRPDGGKNMTFAFGIHLPSAGIPLNPRTYINASVTELFYTCNEIHDLFYRYGFNEVSGNFQNYNFAKGGRGGDAVIAMAQDGSGVNNANFATPPDGTHPRMRMYTWNPVEPNRDGSFEAGIVIHEFAHGISTRLTGGPANSGCLGWGEAGGMGEGWGDFFATMIRQHSANETDFSMGSWASGRPGGIRNFRYSRNMTINTDTYKTLDKPGYWGVHAIGEVWAEMLFEMAENLIVKHGFESTLFPPAATATSSSFYNDKYAPLKVPKAGNTLALQLVVDGLKLQPCRPAFTDARDAILTADQVLTKGENACEIWNAFSKRGLGPAAQVVGSTPWGGGKHTEDYKLPAKCVKK